MSCCCSFGLGFGYGLVGGVCGELVGERALERRAALAALQISRKIRKFGDKLGVAKEAELRDHQQVADCEAVTLKPLLVAQPLGHALELLFDEGFSSRAAQFRPFLVRVEEINRKQAEDCRLDAIQRSICPLDRAEAALFVAR